MDEETKVRSSLRRMFLIFPQEREDQDGGREEAEKVCVQI